MTSLVKREKLKSHLINQGLIKLLNSKGWVAAKALLEISNGFCIHEEMQLGRTLFFFIIGCPGQFAHNSTNYEALVLLFFFFKTMYLFKS